MDIKKAINLLEWHRPVGAINAGAKPSEDMKAFNLAIQALESQMPVKSKIWESSRYEDGEPFDNVICGNCETYFIGGIEWEDLSDNDKLKKIIQNKIETDELVYCWKCGVKIDWS